MKRKKVLIGLGIALAVIMVCIAMLLLGANLHGVIQSHFGM